MAVAAFQQARVPQCGPAAPPMAPHLVCVCVGVGVGVGVVASHTCHRQDQLKFGGPRRAACDLCVRKETTRWFTRDHPVCVVMECDSCDLPMVVLRAHDMAPSEAVKAVMHAELAVVADAQLGPGAWVVDTVQRTVFDHLHWHARPRPPWARL